MRKSRRLDKVVFEKRKVAADLELPPIPLHINPHAPLTARNAARTLELHMRMELLTVVTVFGDRQARALSVCARATRSVHVRAKCILKDCCSLQGIV